MFEQDPQSPQPLKAPTPPAHEPTDFEIESMALVEQVDTAVVGALHEEFGNTVVLQALQGETLNGFGTMTHTECILGLSGFAPETGNTARLAAMRASQGPADMHAAAANIRLAGGQPLPEQVAARMARVLGHDFSHVRVHTDPQAARLAQQLNAHAFAVENHVWFGSGEFQPGTRAGDELLAHELTHVIQGDEGRLPTASGAGMQVSDPSDRAEVEAESMARSAVAELGRLDAGSDLGVAAAETAVMEASSPWAAHHPGTIAHRNEEDSGEEAAEAPETIAGQIKQALEDGDGEKALDLVYKIDAPSEAEQVLDECKDLASSEFGNTDMAHMARVLVGRGGNLGKALQWQFYEGTDGEAIINTVYECSNEAHKAEVRTDAWKEKLGDMWTLGNEIMGRLVVELGGDLKFKLSWCMYEGSDFSIVQPMIEKAPVEERHACGTDQMRDELFKPICTDEEFAYIIYMMCPDTDTKIRWISTKYGIGGTDAYLDALTGYGVQDQSGTKQMSPKDADADIRSALGEYVAASVKAGQGITGRVAVVDWDEWDWAGIEHYGETKWKIKRNTLNGFWDGQERVWIHKDSTGSHTMIHEAIHAYDEGGGDVLNNTSHPLYEGITEHFSIRVCEELGLESAGGSYVANRNTVVNLIGVVGEPIVASAYFDGNLEGLKSAFIAASKTEDQWNQFIAATVADDWPTADGLL